MCARVYSRKPVCRVLMPYIVNPTTPTQPPPPPLSNDRFVPMTTTPRACFKIVTKNGSPVWLRYFLYLYHYCLLREVPANTRRTSRHRKYYAKNADLTACTTLQAAMFYTHILCIKYDIFDLSHLYAHHHVCIRVYLFVTAHKHEFPYSIYGGGVLGVSTPPPPSEVKKY